MKLARLLLQAFGPFTGKTLDFAASASNLHLIYGPNEAGKSAALRAITDLRFGIPLRSADDFIYATGQMRIAGLFIDDQVPRKVRWSLPRPYAPARERRDDGWARVRKAYVERTDDVAELGNTFDANRSLPDAYEAAQEEADRQADLLRADGVSIGVEAMSDGTADQLYLALRLAALDLRRASHPHLPLVLDDVLITSDDERAASVLRALARFAEGGQVMIFTHHRHLVDLARAALGDQALAVDSL